MMKKPIEYKPIKGTLIFRGKMYRIDSTEWDKKGRPEDMMPAIYLVNPDGSERLMKPDEIDYIELIQYGKKI